MKPLAQTPDLNIIENLWAKLESESGHTIFRIKRFAKGIARRMDQK